MSEYKLKYVTILQIIPKFNRHMIIKHKNKVCPKKVKKKNLCEWEKI